MNKSFYVYILASKKNGTLYVGVTSNLVRRVWLHKHGITKGFVHKYSVKNLVYYEQCQSVYNAITREKNLKNWKREWKLELIRKFNPDWRDLYDTIV